MPRPQIRSLHAQGVIITALNIRSHKQEQEVIATIKGYRPHVMATAGAINGRLAPMCENLIDAFGTATYKGTDTVQEEKKTTRQGSRAKNTSVCRLQAYRAYGCVVLEDYHHLFIKKTRREVGPATEQAEPKSRDT